MNAKTIWVAWQDPIERRWLPVGRLSRDMGIYRFVYTQGALESDSFVPFAGLPELRGSHEGATLPPVFAQTLSSATGHVRSAGLADDPLDLLALVGGRLGPNDIELFAHPINEDGSFRFRFFVRGIRHVETSARERIRRLADGARLFLMADMQNPYDALALALRTADPSVLVGYCPSYIARDFRVVVESSPQATSVVVERVDLEAPPQTMLLCSMTGPWPRQFRPCSEEIYQPVAEGATSA